MCIHSCSCSSPNWQRSFLTHARTHTHTEQVTNSTCLNLSHSSRFSARGLLCRSKDRQVFLPPPPLLFLQRHLAQTLSSPQRVHNVYVATSSSPCYFCLCCPVHTFCTALPPLPLMVWQFLLRLFSLPQQSAAWEPSGFICAPVPVHVEPLLVCRAEK